MFEELDNSAYVDEIRHLEAKVKQFEDQYNKLQDRCRIHFDENITEQLFFLYKHEKGISCKLQFFFHRHSFGSSIWRSHTAPTPTPSSPTPVIDHKVKRVGFTSQIYVMHIWIYGIFLFWKMHKCTCLVYSFFLFWDYEKLFIFP